MLQRSSSIGLGAYSGSNESLFGAKGPAGFLAKFTAIMALVFVVNTIALSYFYQKNKNNSILDTVIAEQEENLSNKNTIPTLPISQTPIAPISIKPVAISDQNITNTNESIEISNDSNTSETNSSK